MQKENNFEEVFLHKISSLAPLSDKLLLTVSGGVDSTVMLHLFLQTDYLIGIAHCNFKLRGKDSDEDELFVKQLAEKHNIPFYSISFETEEYAKELGISIQMAARELRYEWFRKIAQKHDYTYIATAHQRNDVIETFLVNTLRKTGIKGFCGIKTKTDNLIRPLLAFSRQEIENYALEHNISFREDQSNHSDNYVRNYIRLHIIPTFNTLQSNFEEVLFNTIDILNQQENIYRHHIEQTKKETMLYENNIYTIDIQKLKELTESKTYLFEWIYPFGFNMEQAEKIITVLDKEPGKLFYSPTHVLLKDRTALIIKSRAFEKSSKLIENNSDNESFIAENLQFEYIKYKDDFEIEKNTQIAYFDADKLVFPLLLRKWEHGDIFYPFGMQGCKKLSDYFTDNKISLFDKENTDILCNYTGEIIWIVGHRSDNRYRLTPHTENVLKITRL